MKFLLSNFACESVVCYGCVMYFCVLSFFFFFKQKTAYELRISDWSSDVCSSDLPALGQCETAAEGGEVERHLLQLQSGRASSRERGCRTCRSRWSPNH